jgi:hypothetical protein
MEQTIKECCPPFHPEKWDNKAHHWEKKKFIKASVPTLFHIPLPPMLGKKITKMMKMAEDSEKLSDEKEDILLLFNDPTAFKSDLYLSVTNPVPNAENTTLSGTFKSKVFDGAYNAIPKFMKQMDTYLGKQDIKANNYYVHYAYCPKCAKEAGHNYMVFFAEVGP